MRWVLSICWVVLVLLPGASLLNGESASIDRGIRVVTSQQETMEQQRLNYHALVIGLPISEETDLELNKDEPLSFQSLQDVLSNKYGFEVTSLVGADATVLSVDKALREYVTSLNESDLLLIVYSGATEMDTFLDESYWILAPQDSSEPYNRSSKNWFSCNRLLKYVAAMDARHVLIVNEGDFVWDKERGISIVGQSSENNWHMRVLEQPSRMIFNRSFEKGEQQGVLLNEWMDILVANESPFIATSEISLVYRDVTGDTNYELGRLHDFKGGLKGEFVFTTTDTDWELIEDPSMPYSPSGSTGVAAGGDASEFVNAKQAGLPGPSGSDGDSSSDIQNSYEHFEASLVYIPMEGLNEGRDAVYQDGIAIESFGCEETYDSVVGTAWKFENRAFVRVQNRAFSDLALNDFSISFWIKANPGPYVPIVSISENDRGIAVALASNNGLSFTVHGPQKQILWDGVFYDEALDPEKWYHVVAVKRDQRISLYINRELIDELEDDYFTFGENSSELFIGKLSNTEGTPNALVGVLDEIRIHKVALSDSDIDKLYKAKFLRFGISPTVTVDSADMDRVARRSFGPNAKMADWRTIVNLFEGECEEFMNEIGFEHWEGAFVRCDGQRIWKDNRHFLATRHSGTPRDYYLVHEHLDDHQLDLGSWFMTNLKVLVQKY